MKIYISFEGFQLGQTFVGKELHILGENDEYKHIIFKAPTDIYLNDKHLQTIRYTTRYLSQLGWHDGDMPYEELPNILKKFVGYPIYTYGYTSTNFLQLHLPTSPIIDVQQHGLKLPNSLPPVECFIKHTPRLICKT